MKDKILQDEGNATLVQQHELSNTQNKIVEINSCMNKIQQEQDLNKETLDNAIASMQSMLDSVNVGNNESLQVDIALANLRLEKESTKSNTKQINLIDELDSIVYDESMSWEEYLS